MKISVIMSVYNSNNSLKDSIESILNQTYENLELLICDDVSSDKSYDVCLGYEKNDSRVRILRNNRNIGLTKSLNKLIEVSKGDLIARQDSDDISLINRFEKQIYYFKNQNYDAILSRAKRKESNKVIPNYSYYIPNKLSIKYKNPFIHGTLMIKKEVLQELGNYNENFYYSQDYKLFTDLLNKGYKIKHLKEPLYVLNMKDNISTNFKKEQDYYSKCVRKNKDPNKYI